MEYRVAEEVAGIGHELIGEHHAHLLGVRVTFLFMSDTPKSKGKEVWGRTKKISGLNAFLALGEGALPDFYADQPFDFFVVEISEEAWERLTEKGKRALVDHELSHCDIQLNAETGETKLAIVGHDVTEFEAVLRRHGLWNESVEGFVKAGAEQLSFAETTG